MIICSDNFEGGAGGSDLGGRTSSGGQVWSANLDGGHSGGAMLYPTSGLSTKVGERNSAPNSSAAYALVATPPSPDYGINFTFEFGASIPNSLSIMPILRLQEAIPSFNLHYYGVWYNSVINGWQIVLNNGSGVSPIATYLQSYSPGTILNYILRACGSTIELFESGVSVLSVVNSVVTLAGQAGVVTALASPTFTNTDGWWITNFEASSTSCTDTLPAQFGLYFAGSGLPLGQDFSVVDYGAPTTVIIPNPSAGLEFAIPVTPLDLAGFLSGRMGNIKLRRNGADVQETSPVVLRGISLQYKKKT